MKWVNLGIIGAGIIVVFGIAVYFNQPAQQTKTTPHTTTPPVKTTKSTPNPLVQKALDNAERVKNGQKPINNTKSYSGSGHSAGYDWGEQNDICDTEYDNGNSESFNEGVREYAEENCS